MYTFFDSFQKKACIECDRAIEVRQHPWTLRQSDNANPAVRARFSQDALNLIVVASHSRKQVGRLTGILRPAYSWMAQIRHKSYL